MALLNHLFDRSPNCARWLAVASLAVSVAVLGACGGSSDGIGIGQAPAAAPATSAPRAAPPAVFPAVLSGTAQGAVAPIPGNAVSNTSFEDAPNTAWASLASTFGQVLSSPKLLGQFAGDIAANTGSGYAKLGERNNEINFVYQDIFVPGSGQIAALQFWYQVRTLEAASAGGALDGMDVVVATPATSPLAAVNGQRLKTLYKLTNQDNTTEWVKSPKFDLSEFKGQTVRLYFISTSNQSNPTSFYVDDINVVAANPSSIAPETGWWLNPAEPGRGFAIEKQGNKIFLAGFLYEDGGNADWYVSTLTQQVNGSFTGNFDRYTGGQTFTGAFKSSVLSSKPSNVTLTFDSSASATLDFRQISGGQSRSISIDRFAFVGGKPTSTANWQNGWWLNPAEPGRGYFVEVQGSQAFIGAFMYDASGQPVWYVSSASLGAGQSLQGTFDQYSSGQTLFAPFTPATKLAATPGGYAFSFSSATQGQFNLAATGAKPMSRFVFN